MYPKHENRNVGSAEVERELVRSSVVVVHINTIKAATLEFQIEDTARKNLTRLKKSIRTR